MNWHECPLPLPSPAAAAREGELIFTKNDSSSLIAAAFNSSGRPEVGSKGDGGG